MSSAPSCYVPNFHCSSGRDCHPTHSHPANHCFPYHDIPNSGLRDELIRLLISMYDCEASFLQGTSPSHGNAANGADVFMRKPRRFL